jgi:hypothetical protein
LTCSSPAYSGRCGVALSNGCGGTIAQCNCSNGQDVCNTTSTPGSLGSCSCTPRTCSGFYANECGTLLPNGCGGTINCTCLLSDVCSTNTPGGIGTCQCSRRTCSGFYAGQCGNGLSDGCGGTITCGCGAGSSCSAVTQGEVGSCASPGCVPRDCLSDYTARYAETLYAGLILSSLQACGVWCSHNWVLCWFHTALLFCSLYCWITTEGGDGCIDIGLNRTAHPMHTAVCSVGLLGPLTLAGSHNTTLPMNTTLPCKLSKALNCCCILLSLLNF